MARIIRESAPSRRQLGPPTLIQEITPNPLTPSCRWSADHLESVASLPFAQLRVLQIQRTFTPITLLPFSPGFYSPVVEGLAIPKKMPINLVEAIVKGRLAKVMDLSLDWWEASEEVLGRILRGCPALENLRLRIPFTMVKMVRSKFCLIHVSAPLSLTCLADLGFHQYYCSDCTQTRTIALRYHTSRQDFCL